MKLFPNFLSIPFDSLLISWVANYAHNRDLLKLHALKSYLKAHSSMNFVSKKYLLQSFLLFCVSRFSVASFNALTSSFATLLNLVTTQTLKYTERRHSNFVILNQAVILGKN